MCQMHVIPAHRLFCVIIAVSFSLTNSVSSIRNLVVISSALLEILQEYRLALCWSDRRFPRLLTRLKCIILLSVACCGHYFALLPALVVTTAVTLCIAVYFVDVKRILIPSNFS